MISRRDVVTDSAIAVVAEQGVRGLTHRAVDALAELPVGSTSNVYRTRDALISGILERIAELNSQQLERLGDSFRDADTPNDVLAVEFCMKWLTTDRSRFYAMAMLSLDPALPQEAIAAKEKNMRMIEEFIMRIAEVGPEMAHTINSTVMGVMMGELISGTADRERIEAFIGEFLKWRRSSQQAS